MKFFPKHNYTLIYNIFYTHTQIRKQNHNYSPNQTKNNFIKLLATRYNNETQPHLHAANLTLVCVQLYLAGLVGPVHSEFKVL